jgi:hypothetical protein
MRACHLMLFAALASGPALAQTKEVPLDVGPDTPQANQAFHGGGVILQGQPGAPAPRPQALPPETPPPPTATGTPPAPN